MIPKNKIIIHILKTWHNYPYLSIGDQNDTSNIFHGLKLYVYYHYCGIPYKDQSSDNVKE
jgi:hypothetical protein